MTTRIRNDNNVVVPKETQDLYFIYPLEKELIEIFVKNIIPDSLNYSYSPNFSGQGTLGRLSPIQIYSGGTAKEYSFTLTVHEDMMINTNYNSIIDFVDAIKALSYPSVSFKGILKKPQVEFHLGEISGLGIVKTNINWKKPFRDGRYIMADISFTVTLEEILPNPEVEEIILEEEVSSAITYNSTYAISDYYEEFFEDRNYIEDSYIASGRTGSTLDISDDISDFITWETSDEEKIANIKFTAQYFELSQGLFTDIYNNFTEGEIDTLDPGALIKLNDLQNSVGLLGEVVKNLNASSSDAGSEYRGSEMVFYIPEISDVVTTNYGTTQSISDLLDSIEDNFYTFLDYYFDNVDLEMSEEDYERAKSEVEKYVDNMRDMYEEVYSYAPSN